MRTWLIDVRVKKHLTQAEVAKMCEITQPTYCNIEKAKISPSPATAKRIAAVLGFDWTKFFEDTK